MGGYGGPPATTTASWPPVTSLIWAGVGGDYGGGHGSGARARSPAGAAALLCFESREPVVTDVVVDSGRVFLAGPSDPLIELLRPERLTAVVDVGANPLNSDGEPPYKSMLVKGLCTVVGFEPQPEAQAALDARKSAHENYLPYAVGDGANGVLKVCRARGMTSLRTPDMRKLRWFPGFVEYGTVIQEIPIATRTLDSIAEIKELDLLKIDVQGEELAVFRHGASRLQNAVALQTEISFVPLYENQPVFGDIDLELRALGFLPHMFVNINKRMILPVHDAARPFAAINQLLEADIVYVRDFTKPENMTSEQLKHLAIIAHHCYSSYDLAANCIHHLDTRGSILPGGVERYLAMIKRPN